MRYLILSLFFFPFILFGQFNVSGTIINDGGEKLSFATVFLQGTTFAASTDDNGYFMMQDIPQGSYNLVVKFIGYRAYNAVIQVNDHFETKITLSGDIYNLDAVEILSNRVGKYGPFTRQNLDKTQLQKENLGQDVPIILQWTPSMVVTSDAGTGIGYTGMRLRGSDQTRINVTLNGVPVNEAESHNVFWVDLPDLLGSVNSIQIQRGVGTSTNGAGAFGGTVSINTSDVRVNPYIDVAGTLGAFGTRKISVNAGTGLINDRYVIDARYSNIQSDGYVDRATANLNSLYFSAARVTAKSSLRFNVISGKEITYQSWNGVPQAKLENNQDPLLNHYYNNLGSIYKTAEDSVNLFSSDRRYNYYTYGNQIDNYRQTYLQLLHSLVVNTKLKVKTTLYYTKGGGYYEEFRANDKLSNYNIPDITFPDDGIISRTDLVRRRWLQTDLLGALFDVEYQWHPKVLIQAGLAGNQYFGDHYGNVIQSKDSIPNFDKTRRYYDNEGEKQDISAYLRAMWTLKDRWTLHGDLQLRKVNYSVAGIDNDLRNIDLTDDFLFFNPKVGVNYALKSNQNLYASLAVANKEPSRGDFIDNAFGDIPVSERLQNMELGYQYLGTKTRVETNVYYMNYKNQLVQTGELNDVGAAIRQNVDRSYRLGWEGSITQQLGKYFAIHGNLALSANKIKAFDEALFDYTNGFEKVIIAHKNTDISFSPSVVSAIQVMVKPMTNLEVEFSSKFVSKQYLDNTSNEARSLPSFHYENLRASYTISSKYWKSASITLMVNNVFDIQYSSNGYTYSYIFNDLITENFLYPQAGRHMMFGCKVGL